MREGGIPQFTKVVFLDESLVFGVFFQAVLVPTFLGYILIIEDFTFQVLSLHFLVRR